MKKIIGLMLSLMMALGSEAQLFEASDSMTVVGALEANGKLVDYNLDTYLDYLFVQYDSVEAAGLSAYLLAIDSTGILDSTELDRLKLGIFNNSRFELADFNNDSRPDLLTNLSDESTPSTLFYNGQYSVLIDSLGFRRLKVANLGKDGYKDIVIEDSLHRLKIKRMSEGVWLDWLPDFYFDKVTTWAFADLGPDGEKLLVVATDDESFLVDIQKDSVNMELFDADLTNSILLEEADFDNDGFTELISLDQGTGLSALRIIRRDTSYIISTLDEVSNALLFLADLNSDGLLDIHLSATQADDYLQIVYLQTATSFEQDTIQVYDHRVSVSFGDLDWDGDLDKIESHVLDSVHYIIYFENTTEEQNLAPRVVENFYEFMMPRGFALVWSAVTDDHTPDEAITYDVFVGNELNDASAYSGNFIPQNAYRYLPSAGTIGAKPYFEIRGLATGRYNFGIQSIDNSFHYLSGRCEGGLGGDGDICGNAIACGTQDVCESLLFVNTAVCYGDSLALIFSEPKALLSSKEGFLGVRQVYEFLPQESDTIYVESNSCDSLAGYVIHVIDNTERILPESVTVCKDDLVQLNVAGMDSVFWYDRPGNLLSNDPSLEYLVEQEEIITVHAYKNYCILQDTILIKASLPEISDVPDEIVISKGEYMDLRLPADYTYIWSPEEGVEAAETNQPRIVTRQSNTYNLMVMDSIGCAIEERILVTVIDRGWIPDLFTPNNDGNNDLLKIYGLENVRDFEFLIYSRSGELVYQANTISAISIQGWDGTKDGVPLPVGVYTWRVRGNLDDNSPIQLNENTSGNIFLVR